MKNRSEAQLGAFLLAYLYEHGSPCAFFEEELLVHGKRASISNFRNRVTHQGYIPSQIEAYCLGEKAYKWLAELSATLLSAHFEAVHTVQEEARALQFEACQKEGLEISAWVAGGTIIDWTERTGPKQLRDGTDQKISQRTFSEGLLDLNDRSIWQVGAANPLPDGIEPPDWRGPRFYRSMTATSHPPKKRSRK